MLFVVVLFTTVCCRSSIVVIYTTDMNSCKGHARFASLGEGGRAGSALPSSLLRSSPPGDSTQLQSPPSEAAAGSSAREERSIPGSWLPVRVGPQTPGCPRLSFCLSFYFSGGHPLVHHLYTSTCPRCTMVTCFSSSCCLLPALLFTVFCCDVYSREIVVSASV